MSCVFCGTQHGLSACKGTIAVPLTPGDPDSEASAHRVIAAIELFACVECQRRLSGQERLVLPPPADDDKATRH